MADAGQSSYETTLGVMPTALLITCKITSRSIHLQLGNILEIDILPLTYPLVTMDSRQLVFWEDVLPVVALVALVTVASAVVAEEVVMSVVTSDVVISLVVVLSEAVTVPLTVSVVLVACKAAT